VSRHHLIVSSRHPTSMRKQGTAASVHLFPTHLSEEICAHVPQYKAFWAVLVQVAYNFSLPYVKFVQKDGLVYPVHIWRDADNGMMRQDTYDGVNSMVVTKVCLCRSACDCLFWTFWLLMQSR
jgi:hypothetical protein